METLKCPDDSLIKKWLEFREEDFYSKRYPEEKAYYHCLDEITESILNAVSENNAEYVKGLLEKLDDNYMDYLGAWSELYYRNGFADGFELINNCK